jgi:hypothetical protein
MRLLEKQKALILLVMSKAGIGVPADVVHENSFGA